MKMPPRRVIGSVEKAEKLLKEMYPDGVMGGIAPEWEFTGLDTEYYENPDTGEVHIGSVQITNDKVVYFIEGPEYSKARGKKLDLVKLFQPYFGDARAKKAFSTPRAEYNIIHKYYRYRLAGLWHDTEIADWLLDENRRSHGLKAGASDFLGIFMQDYNVLFRYHELKKSGGHKKAHKTANILQVIHGKDKYKQDGITWSGKKGRKMLRSYAGKDPVATFRLAKWQRIELKKQDLFNWFKKVELPLAETLINMERRGIGIDVDTLDNIHQEVAAQVKRIEHVIRARTDEPNLNIRSGPQMQKLLFEKLGWEVLERKDLTEAQEEAGQEEGNASIAKGVLQEYAKEYDLAKWLLDHRLYATMDSTFLQGALRKRNRATGNLHTIFKQAKVVTGRLSSGDRQQKLMNLQNIPAKKEKDPYKLRRFFRANLPDYGLIVGDYSQVELYIIAQMSGDKRMIQAFKRGEDLHMLTASKIFNIPLPKEPSSWDPTSSSFKEWLKACEAWKEKYKDERGDAKIVNFGLNYGMSAFKLAMDHGMEIEEAEAWIAGYFELYPGVEKFMANTIQFAHDHGYVTTISGRRRRSEDIHSSDKKMVGRAERQLINAPIQGSAADIIKIAMNALEHGPKYVDFLGPDLIHPRAKKHLEILHAKGSGFAQLIQVHDELVNQAPNKKLKEFVPHVRAVMECPFPKFFKDINLTASVGYGPNWADAKV